MSVSPFLKNRYLCPAKINIGLEVLNKRTDGYHELNTIFALVSAPCDFITVIESAAFSLTTSDPSLDTGESNLIYKAAKAYAAATGRKELVPLHLHLQKEIPTGAGLGGGSSDAAQTLMICNDFYDQPLPNAELQEIASWVGADVPFFVSGHHMAIGAGIGERLTAIDDSRSRLRSTGVLIVKPVTISIPTRDAYARINLKNRPASDLAALINLGRWDEIRNDFEQVVFAENPELEQLKTQMLEAGAYYAGMSGSGSAIVGLFSGKEEARSASLVYSQASTHYWVSELE